MGNCHLDAHDSNEQRGDASRIAQNAELSATLCAGADETDWYTFTLAAPSYVGVELLFEKDGQDVALELSEHDAGTLIDRSEGGADMQATHQLLQPGTYDIEVQRILGDPSYTLRTYALPTSTPPSTNMGTATRVFCPRFDLDDQYSDRSSSLDMREDFGLEDSPDRWRPASMLVRVLDQGGNPRLGWAPLDDQGCTAPVLAQEYESRFVLEYVFWSHFVRPQRPDTFLITYDCEEMQPCELPHRYYMWRTGTGEAVRETRFIASADGGDERREELLVFWAAAFSESRVSMGLEAHLYARVLGAADVGGGQFVACPSGYCPNGASCETANPPGFKHCRPKTRSNTDLGGHPTINIASDRVNGSALSGAPERKFTIAHEIGHLQTMWVPGIGNMDPPVNYEWCSVTSGGGGTHTSDSPEWQSAAMVEGFADFYATAVFNELGAGAWYRQEDIENDTQRYFAQCQASLDSLMAEGHCGLPGDATMCSNPGGSNETDWAGTLWDFTKVVGIDDLPTVLLLLSDAIKLAWDPGSTTLDAYNNMRHAAILRFPTNGDDFHVAAQTNGASR